jgi:hypothetical protein
MLVTALALLLSQAMLERSIAPAGPKAGKDSGFKTPAGLFRLPRGGFTNRSGDFRPSVPFKPAQGAFDPSGPFTPPSVFKVPSGVFSPPKGEFSSSGDFRTRPGVFYIGKGFLDAGKPDSAKPRPESSEKRIRITQ